MSDQSNTGTLPLKADELMKKELTAKELVKLREQTHGDWKEQASISEGMIDCLEHGRNWQTMPSWRRAALRNIAQKMSRIVSGDHEEPDHWDDIAGYSHLGKDGHSR